MLKSTIFLHSPFPFFFSSLLSSPWHECVSKMLGFCRCAPTPPGESTVVLSGLTCMKWSPINLILAGRTSNVNNKHLQRKDFQTLRGLGRISTDGAHGCGSPWFSEIIFLPGRSLVPAGFWLNFTHELLLKQVKSNRSFTEFIQIPENPWKYLDVGPWQDGTDWWEKTNVEAGEVHGSNQCKFTVSNGEKFLKKKKNPIFQRFFSDLQFKKKLNNKKERAGRRPLDPCRLERWLFQRENKMSYTQTCRCYLGTNR